MQRDNTEVLIPRKASENILIRAMGTDLGEKKHTKEYFISFSDILVTGRLKWHKR